MGSTRFIVSISTELAETEPQLTLDFLTEYFVGWDSFMETQRPITLAYMAPWLPGLRKTVLASEKEPEKGREKVSIILRKLIDIAVSDPGLIYTLENVAWSAIAKDEMLLEMLLEEMTKVSMSYDNRDDVLDNISSAITGIGSITLCGKIISRLRKALNRSSLRPTRNLLDNAVWPEICILLRFCLALSFNNTSQAQLFLPEIFHIVTMLANTGSHKIRLLVYRLLINSIHSLAAGSILDEVKVNKLKTCLESLYEPSGETYPSLQFLPRDGASNTTAQEYGPSLVATEHLASTLFDVCSIAASSVDMSNTWRARWMSLVASTAFQNNPAIQPRAFTVMGYLVREEVDDDLLYQVLVALRNSIDHSADDIGNEMLVSIITSLSKMMAKLPSASRYGMQLFWLAICLVRLVPASLFNCTAHFLNSVLTNIGTMGDVRGDHMVPLLLQGKLQLDEVALQLDEAYEVHFNEANFHFAVCACLARGLTDTATRRTATHVLSSFLEMTTWSPLSMVATQTAMHSSPYFALILSRNDRLDEVKQHLWSVGVEVDLEELSSVSSRDQLDLKVIKDRDLVLCSCIELVDFQYLEDTIQAQTLVWLNRLAAVRPAVVKQL